MLIVRILLIHYRLRVCSAMQKAAADEKTAYHLSQMNALNLIVSYLDCPMFRSELLLGQSFYLKYKNRREVNLIHAPSAIAK